MEKKQIHIISHSHWDREWYLPFEKLRIRLVEMIDKLLDYLDREPAFVCFMLDGHSALVEDYLAIRPQNRMRLQSYIQSGRILIGPWYVLPDEVLITGESHIRNYLIGDRVCKALGAKMNVGYMPDAFGHPSQMPQILKKLGFHEMIFWRGLSNAVTKTEFIWEGPDGSRVLGIHLLYGYGNSPHLPDQKEAFLSRIENMVAHYEPASTTNVFPIMNGRDHLQAQECIVDMVNATKDDAVLAIRHSSLPTFVAELSAKVPYDSLEVYRGEMRSSDKTLLLGGTLSSRMYLKQENYRVCHLFERWVEPFAALQQLICAVPYPIDFITQGWKYILLNNPHDSICGCGIDEIHQEMMTRYHCARQIGEELLDRALSGIVSSNSAPAGQEEYWFQVFNPLPYSRSAVVRCSLDLYPQLYNQLNYAHLNQREYTPYEKAGLPFPNSVVIADMDGNRYPARLLHAQLGDQLRLSNEEQPKEYKTHRYDIAFLANDIPGFGYKAFRILPSEEPEQAIAEQPARQIENEFYRVSIEQTGLAVFDKLTGQVFHDCAKLTDGADCGDEYTYSYTLDDYEVTADLSSCHVETRIQTPLLQQMRVSGVLRLPQGVVGKVQRRSDELVDCPYCLDVFLYKNVRRIDFAVTFENHADNHRLRILFPSDLKTELSWAQNAFSVDAHPIHDPARQTGTEKATTDCQKDFVSVFNTDRGVTVFNRGLPEYELLQSGEQSLLAVTLLRCVDSLSKESFPTRTGDAGWCLETPEAQCKGTHRFELAFATHGGIDTNVSKLSMEYENSFLVRQFSDNMRPVHAKEGFLDIDNEHLILSSIKMSEDGDALILRVYNASSTEAQAAVRLGFDISGAAYCDLKEAPQLPVLVEGSRSFHLSAKPWEILTIRMSLL